MDISILNTAFAAVLGVQPQALFWSAVGATLGMSWAAPAAKPRAIMIYVCVVLASSMLGTHIATLDFGTTGTARNTACVLLGIFFHPLLGALFNALPELVSGWTKRLGGGSS